MGGVRSRLREEMRHGAEVGNGNKGGGSLGRER